MEEEEEEVGFTVPRGRSARQYAVRGPCGDFTTDRLPLLSSSYSPFVSLSRRLSAFSPLIFVLGFSTRVLVSQFLNKKTICDVYSTSFLQSRAKSIVPLSLYRGLSFVSISNLLKMIICLNNSSCQFNIIFFLLFLPN